MTKVNYWLFLLTPGNVDDRKPVPEMTQNIIGQLFGDRGYISQELFEELYERQLQLITRYKKNVNLLAGLTAYSYLPQKPSLDLEPKALAALPPAVF